MIKLLYSDVAEGSGSAQPCFGEVPYVPKKRKKGQGSSPAQIMEQQMMEELQKRKEEQLQEAARREVPTYRCLQYLFSLTPICSHRGVTFYRTFLALFVSTVDTVSGY